MVSKLLPISTSNYHDSLGKFGLNKDIPHAKLPELAGPDLPKQTSKAAGGAPITPDPKKGAWKVSSASGKKLSISEKAKHKGKVLKEIVTARRSAFL